MVAKCLPALSLLLAAVLTLAGCSGGTEEEVAERAPDEEVADVVEEAVPPSDAARSRGIPLEEEPELKAEIVLEDLEYEWRLSPRKGLLVRVEFVNPFDVFERARGYAFLIADYSERPGVNPGTYPLDIELVQGNLPDEYTLGSRLLFRKDQTVQVFIPYTDREGHYDSLKILVYSDEGELEIDKSYKLEVYGEPTGRVKPKPTLVL